MKAEGDIRRAVRKLLASQPLAVLCSADGDQPYASLVAYAYSPDLKSLLFATGRFTRKYENLCDNRKAALLVDTRTNRPVDFAEAAAVTAVGEVKEVSERGREAFLKRYLKRHPSLADFVRAPSTALFRLRVKDYVLVRTFQKVDILTLTSRK